ncbi:TIGR03668 family PPOX class F420-dependent oxidoreductase [Kineosporia sp. NBRC 101731]|uniref:TIGR03668 family PPOX class F420-dependent oxidoreductase n=1 Tax=Kineosporia sp. NBRC 101731 TaxID=3032199 RepID=UPI0024A0F689|nr:TIGR03668 family PPOX class F420-dependent oxidoreductase [Kineosporia sp. NBRC 101731]GLY33701.1 PPOX class F420-dependent oxidoreductase [Kineosporia sp. NBRC 101731]
MPTLTPAESRERFLAERVARLATVSVDGMPHLVPLVFAAVGPDVLVSAVDHKPQQTSSLRRLANIDENPKVTLLTDRYDEDWSQLWWARADGVATVLTAGGVPELDALVARYEQYRDRRPQGPVILVRVRRWSGWSAS